MSRLVLVVAGLAAVLVLAVLLVERSPGRGPEPIVHGQDACARCRMIISRPGFAGELRDRDGVLTKYDDVGCLLQAMVAQRGEMPEAWVEDNATGALVPLLGATFVRVTQGETPMGHGVVAFSERSVAERFAAGHEGRVVALEDLVRDPAVVAAHSPSTNRGHP